MAKRNRGKALKNSFQEEEETVRCVIEIELSYCMSIKRKRKKSLKYVNSAEIDEFTRLLKRLFYLT